MKITVLMENTTPSDRFAARHGLSLFLETEDGARILRDELGERIGYLYAGVRIAV